MTALNDLPRNDLLRALYACDGIVHFRDYVPAGLLALTGRFRDEISATLGDGPAPLPAGGTEQRPITELGARKLETLIISVGILLRRHARHADDPELARLLGELHGELIRLAAERRASRALAGATPEEAPVSQPAPCAGVAQ